MKLKTLITVFLLSVSSLLAGEKFDKLTTLEGKTYTKVEVTKQSPADILISHEGGMARIPFSQLDAATVKVLGGYDPKKAKEFAEKEKAELEAAEASLDAELAKLAKSGKTQEQSLQDLDRQIQNDKTITPEVKAERRRLVIKKLDKVKLEKGKLESSKLEPSTKAK